MRHYGADSCKHTYLWSNSPEIRQLSLGKLSKETFPLSWFFVGMGFECYKILFLPVIEISWHPCGVATGAAKVCSTFGGEACGS